MVVDYCLSCKELTALQSCKNINSLYKTLRYSWKTPEGLQGASLESLWTPSILQMESTWSPPGVYLESIRSPDTVSGVHQDPWGSVTYSASPLANVEKTACSECCAEHASYFKLSCVVLAFIVLRDYYIACLTTRDFF